MRLLVPSTIVALLSIPALAQVPPPSLKVQRAPGAIALDGDLSDWTGVTPIETWFETNPGDNVPPAVKNRGYLAYDEKYFYAAFDFEEPQIKNLRAPFGDRDHVPGSTDYGGVIINPSNDRKTAILFLANPRATQYDAITSDASGEDSAPDWYWDAAARIHPERWTLEIRIPFSSLRYSREPVQTWGIMLYRNHPRDRRQQYFTTTLPRGGNCFICRSNELTGLENLPAAGNIIVAPYVTARQESFTGAGLGTPLQAGDAEFDGGVDAKWTPNADTAVDITVNPDFSQVESDVAQIATNERFAIFFPEKRPFFLEGIDLFSTPFRAVHTRSITSPKWGARATGVLRGVAYTVLVTDDRGGGSVILPGPNSSQFAPQDFETLNLIARARYDRGNSFASFLVADRELDGGGHNRVFGPDFRWNPNERHTLTGQLVFSESRTPVRPETVSEWNGQKLSGHAGQLWYFYGTPKLDFYTENHDVADEFRADLGFIPQVGYRRSYNEGGRTWRPEKGLLNRIRVFSYADYQAERDGSLIFRDVSAGVSLDARKWNSNMRLWPSTMKTRAGSTTVDHDRLNFIIQTNPGRILNLLGVEGWLGEGVDFSNAQQGDGANLTLYASVRPNDHLELRFDNNARYLDIPSGRLFTAQVERLKATYTFNARSFLRLIGQHQRTDSDFGHQGGLSASALYGYKLNWQTVLFVGYGDNRTLTELDARLEPSDRQLFLKVSYALLR